MRRASINAASAARPAPRPATLRGALVTLQPAAVSADVGAAAGVVAEPLEPVGVVDGVPPLPIAALPELLGVVAVPAVAEPLVASMPAVPKRPP